MLSKVKELIDKSKSLPQESKDKYLRILKFMSDEDLHELESLLIEEQEGIRNIELQMAQEESQFNQKAIKEFEELYKKEYKSAVLQVENKDQENAEEMINNISQ